MSNEKTRGIMRYFKKIFLEEIPILFIVGIQLGQTTKTLARHGYFLPRSEVICLHSAKQTIANTRVRCPCPVFSSELGPRYSL